MDRILHLVTALIVFVFVLFITVYTTRWVAGFAKKQQYNRNIELIETFRVAQNKHIAIVRTADKYLVIGVGKDEINCLAELEKEDIDFKDIGEKSLPDFGKLIEKAGSRLKKKDGDSPGAV